MRHHLVIHRFVSGDEPASTRIQFRKEFDVALARKMLRDGKTLADVASALDRHPASVRQRLIKLGLGYLISDRVRVSALRSKGQIKRLSERDT
jgi:transposase-like protein